MKRYVYPAVLHSDSENETFTVFFPDLDIVAQGDSTEDCYEKAKKVLQNYFKLVNKFSAFVPEPTPNEAVVKNNPGKIVFIADVTVEDTKIVLSDSDLEYKNFMKMFFDEE